jgi:crossover junction endodeoxyribonuclease RuvC
VRVVGIDPGLTRCGIGIIDAAPNRTARLVHVSVIRTPPDSDISQRLLEISTRIDDAIRRFAPDSLALERVFAQHNLRTVMGTAQASGVALLAAARAGIPVGVHTPSEVKAAITGYGSADKRQIGVMVARILRLDEAPTPADASDALALAICHAWWTTSPLRVEAATKSAVAPQTTDSAPLTAAQRAWQNAERSARNSAGSSVVTRRLAQ